MAEDLAQWAEVVLELEGVCKGYQPDIIVLVKLFPVIPLNWLEFGFRAEPEEHIAGVILVEPGVWRHLSDIHGDVVGILEDEGQLVELGVDF